jgi:hypothetical protein
MAARVTEDEKREYFDFVKSEIKKLGPKQLQPVLWHYTSGDGLIGIIKSGKLWLTQISCVNDATELRYSQSLLLQAIQRSQAQFLSIEARWERQETGQLQDEDDIIALFNKAIAGLSADAAPTSEWFVGCLSSKDDDLSQWRAYAGGEGGYAIGFDTATMLLSLTQDQNYLTAVCYDEHVHNEIAQSVADATVVFYKKGLAARPSVNRQEWTAEFLTEWSRAITYIAPAIKHPTFEAEQEWRILRQLRETDVPDLCFRQRQSMLARHLPVPMHIPGAPSNNRLLPIAGVRIGPSRHKQISKISVADLLRGMKYPESVYNNVLVSKVPFQAF